eukprot:Nk52_evm14s564 gene=Nk52_evmTU14s564
MPIPIVNNKFTLFSDLEEKDVEFLQKSSDYEDIGIHLVIPDSDGDRKRKGGARSSELILHAAGKTFYFISDKDTGVLDPKLAKLVFPLFLDCVVFFPESRKKIVKLKEMFGEEWKAREEKKCRIVDPLLFEEFLKECHKKNGANNFFSYDKIAAEKNWYVSYNNEFIARRAIYSAEAFASSYKPRAKRAFFKFCAQPAGAAEGSLKEDMKWFNDDNELVSVAYTELFCGKKPYVPKGSMSAGCDEILSLVPKRFKSVGNMEEVVDINLDLGRTPFVYRSIEGCGMREALALRDDYAAEVQDASPPTVNDFSLHNRSDADSAECPEEVLNARDLENALEFIGGEEMFGDDNRAGINGTLHRISAIRNKANKVIGLTLRMGRFFPGNSLLMTDVLLGTDRCILILGVPGSGKTTFIRDCAARLSRRSSGGSTNFTNVCLVDTSNEIAGDGDIPHACIGNCRRMMVPNLEKQWSVMVECVQNHTVGVMVVDEIGRKEVQAAGTVKNRGVRLLGSTHGSFQTLLKNKELNGLLGGTSVVTLGDKAAAARSGTTRKQITERAGAPVFDTVIQLMDRNRCIVINNVASAVDSILDGQIPTVEFRSKDPSTGAIQVTHGKFDRC